MLRWRSFSQVLFATTLLGASTVFAQAPATGAPAQPSPLMSFFPFILMIAIMYILMIRPQQKKQKTHLEFLTKLKRGDEVLTSGGMLGRVEGLTEVFVTLEISPGVRVKILRTQIASFVPAPTQATAEVKA